MSGMLKAGLIGLGVGALFGLGVTLVLPFCTPCVALVVGTGVGFLACLWDRPTTNGASAGTGAQAGAVAGIGHLVGQLLGMVINGLLVGPEEAARMFNQLGLEAPTMDAATYWAVQIFVSGGCGLTNIAIAAGLGALGGLLWQQTVGTGRSGTHAIEA